MLELFRLIRSIATQEGLTANSKGLYDTKQGKKMVRINKIYDKRLDETGKEFQINTIFKRI